MGFTAQLWHCWLGKWWFVSVYLGVPYFQTNTVDIDEKEKNEQWCARLITIRMIVVSTWNTMSMCWWWWRWRRWQATMTMTMVIIIMTVIMFIIIMTYHDYMPSSLSSLSLSSSWFPWHMYMHIYICAYTYTCVVCHSWIWDSPVPSRAIVFQVTRP